MTERTQGGQAIYSQKVLGAVATIIVLTLTVYLTANIIKSDNGSISAAVRSIGSLLAIWAAVKPKDGLYIITIEAFSLDFIKKIAVYYGTTSTDTIIEVLIVGMLAVVGTVGGLIVQGFVLRQYKITRAHWAIVAFTSLVGLAIFMANVRAYGVAKSGENAFNGGAYIALAIPMSVLLAERREIDKLLTLQFWLAVVWAVWGIKQYYTGFAALEWYYADTGLSEVATEHMYRFADPRPFGFGTGVSNYAILTAYFCYGFLRWRRGGPGTKVIAFGSLILLWGIVTSMQRTMLLLPFAILLFYFCFQTRGRTVFVYAGTVFVFILCVLFSETLLQEFDSINDWIHVTGRWGEQVLNVDTYSDRLNSYELLLKPSTYSWFGTDASMPTHDFISKIIFSYGVIGLGIVLGSTGVACYYVHRTLLSIANEDDRKFAIFMVAVVAPTIAVGFAGSGNLHTTPVNLQLWTFFGTAVTIALNPRTATVEDEAPEEEEVAEVWPLHRTNGSSALRPRTPAAVRF